jgi:multidrug transporter EmrE-like cation transporter
MTRSVIILILAIVLNATANILIKVGMLRVGRTGSVLQIAGRAIVQPALLGGIFSFALALAAYSLVLTRLNLSVAYPIMVSMGLVIVVLASYFLLNETITLVQVIGFGFIIAGVWMVAR